jgi:hypothetical protein
VHEPGVGEEALVLVLQVVEQVLGLRLGVLELRGQDLEVVALLHGAHLLVDDLLVHPGEALLDQRHRLGLVHALDVQGGAEGYRQVDDRREAAVGELAAEGAHDERLVPHAVDDELRGGPLGAELDRVRADEVLGAESRRGPHHRPVEHERAPRPEQVVDGTQARLPVERLHLAAHAREGPGDAAAHAREHRHGRVHVAGPDRVGDRAGAHEVGDPLAHLVVEDAVVLAGVSARHGVGVVEERAVADLLGGDRRVGDGELQGRVRPERVVELAAGREDGLLGLLPHGLVAHVGERHRLREEPALHLADAVAPHRLEADRAVDVARGAAALSLLPGPVGELPLLVAQASLD